MQASGLVAGEHVHVVNNCNGARIETYVITGPAHSGCICLNGAAARLFQVGDEVIIMAYAQMTPEEAKTFKPQVGNAYLNGLAKGLVVLESHFKGYRFLSGGSELDLYFGLSGSCNCVDGLSIARSARAWPMSISFFCKAICTWAGSLSSRR